MAGVANPQHKTRKDKTPVPFNLSLIRVGLPASIRLASFTRRIIPVRFRRQADDPGRPIRGVGKWFVRFDQ
jgi:hypothetical protein